jgi:hypothetical protein
VAKKKTAKTSKGRRSKRARAAPGKHGKKVAAKLKRPAAKPAAADDAAAIGRALVTQEEKLYMLFKEDYHARQIFEFLRVETVKDLEQFSPEQIVKLLSQPIQTTVRRIRQKLAEKNRHLLGDEGFVVDYKQRRTDS